MDAREADVLAERARAGDATALTRLYEEYAPALLGYLIRLTGDRAAAEDVIHETFLHLIEKRGRFEARGRFRQWLFVVAANEARTRRRHELKFRELEAVPAGVTVKVGPESELAHRECLAMIEQVLAQLPRGYAEAFHLRVREQFSYREMAAITGEPEGTLRSRVHHALTRLRTRLVDAGAHRGSTSEKEGTQ